MRCCRATSKFDHYLPRPTRLALAALLRLHAHHVDVTAADEALLQPPCRDPKDNKFLALAQPAATDMLVSSDDDLLTLHPWCGVQVITPAAFVAMLADG